MDTVDMRMRLRTSRSQASQKLAHGTCELGAGPKSCGLVRRAMSLTPGFEYWSQVDSILPLPKAHVNLPGSACRGIASTPGAVYHPNHSHHTNHGSDI